MGEGLEVFQVVVGDAGAAGENEAADFWEGAEVLEGGRGETVAGEEIEVGEGGVEVKDAFVGEFVAALEI